MKTKSVFAKLMTGDIEPATVLRAHPAGKIFVRAFLSQRFELFLRFRDLLGRDNIDDAHVQELFSRVPEDFDRLFVDIHIIQVCVYDKDGINGIFKEVPVLLVRFLWWQRCSPSAMSDNFHWISFFL